MSAALKTPDEHPYAELRAALAEMTNVLHLAHLGADPVALAAIVDRLEAGSRDAPSDLVLQAVKIATAAIAQHSQRRSTQSRDAVDVCMRVLSLLAACPPEIVRRPI